LSGLPAIAGPRLDLVSLPLAFLEASLAGERAAAADLLGATIDDEWWDERALLELRVGDLRADPELQPWLLRAMVRRADRMMVGHIGGHWRPGAEHLAEFAAGGIELGYAVFSAFRRQGYATEAVETMIAWIAAQGIPSVVLSVAPDNPPSLAITERLGFTWVGTRIDEIDGLEEVFVRAASASP
jgi:ribosomal-protein-alanine N-acetyltransferase